MAGIAALNSFLSLHSYISGPEAGLADLRLYHRLRRPIINTKLPHLCRWYSHVSSLGAKGRDKLAFIPASGPSILSIIDKVEAESKCASVDDDPAPVVTVQNAGLMGRGVFVKRTFAVGPRIFSERPFVVAPCDRTLGCASCLHAFPSRLSTPGIVPCSNKSCDAEYYCSAACREEAWYSHHRVVCGRNLDPLRQILWDMEAANNVRDPDPDLGEHSSHSFNSPLPTHLAVARLLCMTLARPEYRREMSRVQLMELWPHFHVLAKSKSILEPFHFHLKATKIVLGISDAAPALDGIWYDWAFRRFELNSMGAFSSIDIGQPKPVVMMIGKYCCTLQSFINHHCRPNTDIRPGLGGRIVCVALHHIPAGEQLFIDYTEATQSSDINARLLDLAQRFSFRCRCSHCASQVHLLRKDTIRKLQQFL